MESPEEGWDSSEESSTHTGNESDIYSQGFLSTIWEESTQADTTIAGGEFSRKGTLDSSLRDSEHSISLEDHDWDTSLNDSANRDLWKSITSITSLGEQVQVPMSGDDTSLNDSANRDLWKSIRSLTSGEQVQYPVSDDEYTLATIDSILEDEAPTMRRWSSEFTYESMSMSEEESAESSSITNNDSPGPPKSSQTMLTASVDADETPKASSRKFRGKSNSVLAPVVSAYFTPEFSDDELQLDSPTLKLIPNLPPNVPVRQKSIEDTDAPEIPIRQKSLESNEDVPFVPIRQRSLEVSGDAPGPPIRQKSLGKDEDALDAPHMPVRKNSLDSMQRDETESSSHRIKSISVPVDDDQKDAHLVVEDHLLRQADRSPIERHRDSERHRDHGQRQKLKFDMARHAISPRIEKMISSRMDDLVEQDQALMPPLSNTQPQSLPPQQQQESKIAVVRRLEHRESKRIRIRRKMQQTEARLNSIRDLLDPAAEQHEKEEQPVETFLTDLASTDFLPEGSSELSFHYFSSKHREHFSSTRHICMAGNIGIRHKPENPCEKSTVSKPGETSQLANSEPPASASKKNPRIPFSKSLLRNKRRLQNLLKPSNSHLRREL